MLSADEYNVKIKELACRSFDRIQSDMLIDLMDEFGKKDYDKFRRHLEYLNDFLTIKEKLCPIHTR